jgi:ferredoxin-NADP reductase
MAGTTLRRRLITPWQAARLVETHVETPTARTLRFSVPDWPGHLAGQHVDLRLTAEDGYTAQRSYSLAGPADGDIIELTVQLVPDGEVSSYLAEGMQVGDALEVRGPLGGWFVWRPEQTEPVLLVAGGSGIVPLMAMLRASSDSAAEFRLLYSTRSPTDVFYADELAKFSAGILYTRAAPVDSPRRPHRLDAADLALGIPAEREPTCYVCGPTPFVETAANLLVRAGHDPDRIRTERFGPTGGSQ